MGVIAENNNRAILQNTFILYIRLLVVSVCGLLTTRYALQALGVSDFGLFSVVGGVVSFMAIFNTIMLSTSNRFIAIAIGKNDINEINSSFNVNLLVHVVIAVVTMMMAIPVGNWYIANYINFDGEVDKSGDCVERKAKIRSLFITDPVNKTRSVPLRIANIKTYLSSYYA